MGIDEDGRSRVLDQARAARTALVSVHDLSPPMMPTKSLSREQAEQWTAARQHAQPVIDRFQTTVNRLRRDRLARCTGQAWLEAAIMRWWDRNTSATETEFQAWSFLEQLTTRSCPRSAPRQIRQQLDAVIRAFGEEYRDDIDALATLSKELRRHQRRHGR